MSRLDDQVREAEEQARALGRELQAQLDVMYRLRERRDDRDGVSAQERHLDELRHQRRTMTAQLRNLNDKIRRLEAKHDWGVMTPAERRAAFKVVTA